MNQVPDILHIDDQIIVINKPAGLLSVPGLYNKDCAYARLQAVHGELHIIHRLDMDTSGILVYARNKAALTAVQQQFEKQTTRKVYEALLIGKLKGNRGCVNLPICVDWPNRPLQKICHVDGRYALTRWQRLEQTEDFTRVELYPQTGRSHQLRLHMLSIGHPIIGDPFYAPDSAKENPRLMLHARELDFNHPSSGERLAFVLPAPF
ncbi:RNA pseudouridine synthase [Venatoribacter cucullus]|uniref:RNA pseudouridine synthase n=1 Tax=Venatoribacter cucullus TaxID=2661630 RepID=A0A9X7YPR7_9GAMM|nr:RluA family pseudouridine synthase [Venatoribacter cucullus]QQD24282.1 RNA pseudouridine synthase [Venatoribacter cucullus]